MVPPNNDPSFACKVWALISSLEQQQATLGEYPGPALKKPRDQGSSARFEARL